MSLLFFFNDSFKKCRKKIKNSILIRIITFLKAHIPFYSYIPVSLFLFIPSYIPVALFDGA